jgi:hypothetical protein
VLDRPPVGCVESATRTLGPPARRVRRVITREQLALAIAQSARQGNTVMLEHRRVRFVSSRRVHSPWSQIPHLVSLDMRRLRVIIVRQENTRAPCPTLLGVRVVASDVVRVNIYIITGWVNMT